MRTATVLLVLLFISVSAQGQTSVGIEGGWEWLKTTSVGGEVESPGTVGYSVQVQFSDDGTFLRYRNQELVEQSGWGLSYVWVMIDGGLTHLEFITTELGDQWEADTIIPAAFLELKKSTGEVEEYMFLGPVSSRRMVWGTAKSLFRN